MEFKNPEYIGLMYLHAARYHLEKVLAGTYTPQRARALRSMLPYQILVDEDGHVGAVNRNYKPLGVTSRAWADYSQFPQFLLPDDKCRCSGEEQSAQWVFNDGCPPWRDRETAEAYLAKLNELFDFSTEDLGGLI